MRPAGGAAPAGLSTKGVIVLVSSVCVGPDPDGEPTPQELAELERLVPLLLREFDKLLEAVERGVVPV